MTLIYEDENSQKTIRGEEEVRYYDEIFTEFNYQLFLKLKKDVVEEVYQQIDDGDSYYQNFKILESKPSLDCLE